ncbi:MAG: thioesterase [Ignavibacteriales bacterium]|nr:thioesterase [Ignavibacteriales bacterium]
MKYEREYFIHYYDCDTNLNLNITSLLKYFEDIAILQSEDAGIGLKYYEKNNVAWMLYKWDVIINRYPKYKERIKIITEPVSFFRFYAYRSFEVKNLAGETLATANTLWFFIDTNSRKPTKIIEEMFSGYGISTEEKRELPIDEIKPFGKIDYEKEFFVRQSDIDTNDHVNNISYLAWALEVVPDFLFKDSILKRLKIYYKKETHYGSKIKSLVGINNELSKKICSHKISDGGDDICLLETQWEVK